MVFFKANLFVLVVVRAGAYQNTVNRFMYHMSKTSVPKLLIRESLIKTKIEIQISLDAAVETM